MQTVAKAAALIDRVDQVAPSATFFFTQAISCSRVSLRPSPIGPRPDCTATATRRSSMSSPIFQAAIHCVIARFWQLVKLLLVMPGWIVVFHMNKERVPVSHTLYNPSWHLTASGPLSLCLFGNLSSLSCCHARPHPRQLILFSLDLMSTLGLTAFRPFESHSTIPLRRKDA